MSLTSCLREAGANLSRTNRASIVSLSRKYRTAGTDADAAALRAIEEVLAQRETELKAMRVPAAAAAPQDLLGAAPNASQQAAARLLAERADRTQRQQQAAPGPEEFGLGQQDQKRGGEEVDARQIELLAPEAPAAPRPQMPTAEKTAQGDYPLGDKAEITQQQLDAARAQMPVGFVLATNYSSPGAAYPTMHLRAPDFSMMKGGIPQTSAGLQQALDLVRAEVQSPVVPAQLSVGQRVQWADFWGKPEYGTVTKLIPADPQKATPAMVETAGDRGGSSRGTHQLRDVQPAEGTAPPRPPAPPNPKLELQRKRERANRVLEGLARKARADGLDNLASRLARLQAAPAEVDAIEARYDRLAERARKDPADTFFDLIPTPRESADARRSRMADLERAAGAAARERFNAERGVDPTANLPKRLPKEDKQRLEQLVAEELEKRKGQMAKAGRIRAPSADTLRAKADLQSALADLADLAAKNVKKNIVPEQEAQLLPVLTRVLDAAFRLGYHSFKDAAKFALDTIREQLSPELADGLSLKHLQGAYIAMSGGKDTADDIMGVAAVTSKDEIEAHTATSQAEEDEDVSGSDTDLERDSGEPADQPDAAPGLPGEGGGAADGGGGRATAAGGGGRRGGQGAAGVPNGGPVAGGERVNQRVDGGGQPRGPAGGDPRADFDDRGSGPGASGVQPEPAAGAGTAGSPGQVPDEAQRRIAQRAADKLGVTPGDRANIDATLPYLLPAQRDDVLKAEQRHGKPDGYGMLFTNGTGTGKTFSGLGVVKRQAMQGRTDQLIVVPDNKIAADWIDSAKALNLTITQLESTKTAGQGIVITTYANLGENDELAKRKWHHIVADEAHSLMQSADGELTGYLENLRAITYHPAGEHTAWLMRHREQHNELASIYEQIQSNNKLLGNPDTMDVAVARLRADNERLQALAKPISEALGKRRAEIAQEWADNQQAARTRATFLSATPFAYHTSLDWAQGYLFDYAEGYPYEGQSLRYNQPNPQQHFFMTHLGYRMRYGKLTKPDTSKVDVGMLERQLNSWMKKKGSLSGRMLEVEPDYDRRFVAINSAIGNKIDEAIEFLRDKAHEEHEANRGIKGEGPRQHGWSALSGAIDDAFDFLSRRFLLEAIKAKEAIPIVRQHLAMGRRVVVFHDYKLGSGRNPFDIAESKMPNPGLDQYRPDETGAGPGPKNYENDVAKAQGFNAARVEFRRQFPMLFTELVQLKPPLQAFREAFTEGKDLLVINGNEKANDLLARYKQFQSDDGGPLAMLVQSDKNKGWSGHDTTGKFQRALINLGLPTAPTKLIQLEGRIYRTGVVSDAIMRSLNTGTNWERWAFANTIASRAGTTENLGMGELSRALRDSIIASFENADAFPPGHPGEGKGGKALDRASNNVLSEFDRAKTYYWATGKKTSRNKAEEGKDYFATPEPLGLKMVEWADIRGGEDALEPSGGHGAIARWMPELANRTVIEPSPMLLARLALSMNPEKDRIIDGTFEDHDVVNKYDAIVMNPPFGVGGKQAIDHVAKATRHLRDGGRIVALIPRGPAADKRLEQFLYGKDERAAKPLGNTQRVGDYYAGDRVTVDGREGQFVIEQMTPQGLLFRQADGTGHVYLRSHYIASIVKAGPRTEQVSPSEGLQLVADITLPQSTFERAGTAVASHVIVLEKTAEDIGSTRRIDLSDADDINALFDRIEDLSLRQRAKPAEEAGAADATGAAAAPAAAKPAAPAPVQTERGDEPIVEHVTGKGKTIRGVVRMGITKEQAQAVDPYTFKKDGGWFIREKHLGPPAVSEPPPEYQQPYETDLFGNAVPQRAPAKPKAAPKKRTVIRQQALDLEGEAAAAAPAPVAEAAPDVDAELYVDTLLAKIEERDIGTESVRTPEDAAAASRYLVRSAVERLDAIVTDKNGKVLGVAGGFKGDRSVAAAYPTTVLAETLQIEGAAHVWLSHNHPSGNPTLSPADMNLERAFERAFADTGIQVRGVLAVTPKAYSFVSSGTQERSRTGEPMPERTRTKPALVPVYERHLREGSAAGAQLTSPSQARTLGSTLYDRSGAGIMLLDAQNGLSGWIPLSPRLRQRLTTGTVLRQLLYAVTRNNAVSSILVHGGEMTEKVSGLPTTPPVYRNLVNALSKADVRVLDVINVKSGESLAEQGTEFRGGGELFAMNAGGPERMSLAQVREKIAEFKGMPVAKAQEIVRDLTAGWKGGIEVRVVATARDLPGREIGSGANAARGMYSNGVGYIVAAMHKDRAAIGRTLAHEVIQHHGLRAVLGEDGWPRLMRQIQAAADAGNPEIRAAREFVRNVYRNPDGSYRLREGGSLEADEIAAHLIERSVDENGNMRPGLQWLKWVWAKVAGFLRSVGLNVPFSMPELHGIWVEARRGLEQGSLPDLPTAAQAEPARARRPEDSQYALDDAQIVGNTGRNYTPEQERAMRNVGWVKDPVPLQERMRHLWANLGKTLAQGLVDQFAPIKDISREAYGLLRLSKGASGAFEVMLQGGQLKLTDGAYDFDDSKRGGVVKRLLIPLQGEHHDFFRWVAANRAEQLMAEDRERLFTADDIRALKTLAAGSLDFDYQLQHGARAGQTTRSRAEAYADSLATFNEFNKNALDMAEQSGLIDGESRALWEKEFYVPFYRVADEGDGGIRGMNIKNGVVRQQAFKQLKGGSQQLNADLLENTLMNWAHLLDASAKNRAARATLDVLSNLGNAIEAREGDARSMAKSMGKRNNVVWVMDAGRRRFFLVDDPYMLAAVSALEFAGFRSPIMRAMSTFKHALTVGVTASPFFKVRNLIRDSIQAIGTAPLSANAATNVRQGWAATRPGSDTYFQLLAGGGTIHFGTMMEGSEARRVQSLVESGVDRATILDTGERVRSFYRKTVEPLVTAYNELGNRGEAVNRAALYQQLRAQGATHADASLQARDLMDFSMQGSFNTVRFLTQVVPFMNARMQGLYKLGRAAQEDPARFATVLGAVALFSIGLLGAYSDDDDWKKREDWDRNNYWWFKAGGVAYRIPKPFEIGALATLAERSWEGMFDAEMTGERFREQVISLMGDQLSLNPLPQIVKPVLDVYANRDSFTGRPIETMGMERLQPEYRYRSDTTMVARGASTALNTAARAIGGTAPSPVQIDHLVRGYMGWLGSMVVSAGDTIARPLTEQPDRPQPDYWRVLTGAMVSSLEDAPSRYVSAAYKQAKDLEEIYGTWRHLIREGKMAEAQAFREEYLQELVRYRQVETVKRAQTRLNQLRHQVEEGSGTPEEKRVRIRELDRQADQIARRLAPT